MTLGWRVQCVLRLVCVYRKCSANVDRTTLMLLLNVFLISTNTPGNCIDSESASQPHFQLVELYGSEYAYHVLFFSTNLIQQHYQFTIMLVPKKSAVYQLLILKSVRFPVWIKNYCIDFLHPLSRININDNIAPLTLRFLFKVVRYSPGPVTSAWDPSGVTSVNTLYICDSDNGFTFDRGHTYRKGSCQCYALTEKQGAPRFSKLFLINMKGQEWGLNLLKDNQVKSPYI